MSLKVNEEGVKQAKNLIAQGKISTESDWSKAQPSALNGDQLIRTHGWEEYGKWFLAVDSHSKKDEKKHYEFPYGDFQQVHRSGIIAAKQRAVQYKHIEIEKAAEQLLEAIDKKEGIKTKREKMVR
jgi:hypothetical protein